MSPRLLVARLLLLAGLVATTLAGGSAVAATASCAPVEGVVGLSFDAVLLFGELHGTDRGPEAFGRVACDVARRAAGLVVALEISHREQAALDDYLASEGGPADRERLLAGEWWTDAYQDGRRSEAMAELVDRLRRLRQEGAELTVVAFDPLPDVALGEREEHLARRLAAAHERRPEAAFLVLAGNLHPRTVRGTPWNADFLPMGARLTAAGVGVLAIDIRHAGGTAWTCSGASAASCGSRRVGGSGTVREVPALELFGEPEAGTGYGGVLWVGAVEASPPATGRTAPGGPPAPGRDPE